MVKAWVEKEIEEPPRICEERKKGLTTKDSASLKRVTLLLFFDFTIRQTSIASK